MPLETNTRQLDAKAQAILDAYSDDAGPVPADPTARNAWFRGLVVRAYRAATRQHYAGDQRTYDALGRPTQSDKKVA